MTSGRNERLMHLIKLVDELRRHMTERVCQLTTHIAEAYPVLDGVILEILMETLVSSVARLNIDILTMRYRMLKAFVEENPELSLLGSEADSRIETTDEDAEVTITQTRS